MPWRLTTESDVNPVPAMTRVTPLLFCATLAGVTERIDVELLVTTRTTDDDEPAPFGAMRPSNSEPGAVSFAAGMMAVREVEDVTVVEMCCPPPTSIKSPFWKPVPVRRTWRPVTGTVPAAMVGGSIEETESAATTASCVLGVVVCVDGVVSVSERPVTSFRSLVRVASGTLLHATAKSDEAKVPMRAARTRFMSMSCCTRQANAASDPGSLE